MDPMFLSTPAFPPAPAVPIGTLATMDAYYLVSFWKPLVLLLTLGAWAWVVSAIYDKHAARFFLPREKWNLFHLCAGVAGLAGAVLMPVEGLGGFFAGWGTMIAVLGISLGSYAVVANRDERVPDEFKIRLDILTKMAARREAKKIEKGKAEVRLAIRGPDKQLLAAPAQDSPEAEIRAVAEDICLKAITARASQVDIIPTKDGTYAPSLLVDGVRTQGEPMSAPLALKAMDFWKSAAKLDVSDRRRKLTGEVVIDIGQTRRKIRITSIGVSGGMRLTMLFDPDTAVRRAPNELGLLEPQMEELRKIVEDEKRGVVLLAGVADGGRTTLMYTVMGMHDAYTQSVQAVEIEPQLQLEGVRHQVFDPQAEGADFSTMVRSMLRRDPDVLAVAEMPDANTAKEVARSDVERTRTYLCLKADSALGAIELYVRAVGDAPTAAKGLRGVVFGKLLRKLCTNCKVPYPPAPEMLKKLGIEPGKVQQLFKKGGQVLIKNRPEVCPACNGVGYMGQEGIFEVYQLGDEERDLIAAVNMTGLKAALRKRGLPTLQQAAIRKALAGTTSVEEVQRVAVPAAAAAPAPAGTARANP
jgi:type II secretory ATPase GspE/PulE/Tfp pilus assembly ATPase PilB-like protein